LADGADGSVFASRSWTYQITQDFQGTFPADSISLVEAKRLDLGATIFLAILLAPVVIVMIVI